MPVLDDEEKKIPHFIFYFGSPVFVVLSIFPPKHYNNGQNSKLLLNDEQIF